MEQLFKWFQIRRSERDDQIMLVWRIIDGDIVFWKLIGVRQEMNVQFAFFGAVIQLRLLIIFNINTDNNVFQATGSAFDVLCVP